MNENTKILILNIYDKGLKKIFVNKNGTSKGFKKAVNELVKVGILDNWERGKSWKEKIYPVNETELLKTVIGC